MQDYLITEDPIFFDRQHNDFIFFEMIIKNYLLNIYKNELDQKYIIKFLKNFTHGYIVLESNFNEFDIKDFYIFEYVERLSLIKSDTYCYNNKISLILLECIKKFIIDRKVETWNIFSSPHIDLVAYYEEFGFRQLRTLYVKGQPKVIEMDLQFTYDSFPN